MSATRRCVSLWGPGRFIRESTLERTSWVTSSTSRRCAPWKSATTSMWVSPRGTVGTIEASTMRRPSTPCTRHWTHHAVPGVDVHSAGPDSVIEGQVFGRNDLVDLVVVERKVSGDGGAIGRDGGGVRNAGCGAPAFPDAFDVRGDARERPLDDGRRGPGRVKSERCGPRRRGVGDSPTARSTGHHRTVAEPLGLSAGRWHGCFRVP